MISILQNIGIWFAICLAGAVLYRIGGSSLSWPMLTKFRDWGVSAVGVFYLVKLIPGDTMWSYYIALAFFFCGSWGSLTTYWDKWGTDDVEWYEWMLTGFIYGVVAAGVAWHLGSWTGFWIRTIILTVFMPYSNKLQFKVLWDGTDGVEGSRGWAIIGTLPLLLV